MCQYHNINASCVYIDAYRIESFVSAPSGGNYIITATDDFELHFDFYIYLYIY